MSVGIAFSIAPGAICAGGAVLTVDAIDIFTVDAIAVFTR